MRGTLDKGPDLSAPTAIAAFFIASDITRREASLAICHPKRHCNRKRAGTAKTSQHISMEKSPRTHRERKLNTTFFFSNFSGTSGIFRQNPGISRQQSLVSLVSRDRPNFSAPTPSHGRPPPHPKISGPKSLGLGSFFFPDVCKQFLLKCYLSAFWLIVTR